ncbi:hydroxyacyl-thioester dehydratase type 2, mitochondrial [Ranitomeya imitator]
MLHHLVTGGRSLAVSSNLSMLSCFSNHTRKLSHLQVGDSAEISRTFTQKDVKLFSELTGDTNPLHLDETFAKNTRFEKPVVHGVLLNGLVSAVLGTKLPGDGCVLLSQDIRFPAPLHAGEEVVARAQVKALKRSLAFISVSCVAANGGRTVMEGTVKVLIHGH